MTGQKNEPIAIVGSSCRFAGDSDSPSKLWDLLREPRDVRSEIPDSRFSAKGFYHPDPARHGRSNVMHSYLIDGDLGLFDAEFFGIRNAEAKSIDPQQRFLLETVYESVEAAGMSLEGLRGTDTSVYVGVMCSDYESLLLRDLQTAPTYFATGTAKSILSNRVSYFFDWHGPSITIDTACSSSLVAVHMAVQALRSGDSRVSLACGSNLILGPENYIVESKLKMLSPDGVSRMWDRDANGYARGDGVAAVVLKTLSAAIEDGDHIECIIRETGVNQDGATPGITMPSASAQQNLIRATYAKAGLDLQAPKDRPQYFEAHGTGTPAGDPIEAEAIYNAFIRDNIALKAQSNPLYVGSIKTVLGHTEGTAGIAALLKASLALQNAQIPPNLLFDNLSPSVAPFYKSLEIPTSAKAWPSSITSGEKRRASVNSFGFGGTNAHAIVESYDTPAPAQTDAPGKEALFTPFVFSATSDNSLRATLEQYSTYLDAHPSVNAHDLAWTLRERRSTFPFRATFSAQSIDDLKTQIDSRLQDAAAEVGLKSMTVSKGQRPKVLGVFTGQGAQYHRMGAELMERSSFARGIIQNLEDHLARLDENDRPTWSLTAELLSDATSTRVGEAAISQPLCTAVQILLVDLLRLGGLELDCVVGHSSGEIAAAYAAGYLTARDAICIAYYRGLHVQKAYSPRGKQIQGAMVAVGTSMSDAQDLCKLEEFSGRISVAASNSPSSVTISGDEDAVEELQVILDDEKIFNRRLKVDKAYHSSHMLSCADAYTQSLRSCGVKVQTPPAERTCVWLSSVYNRPMGAESCLDAEYWVDNMTRPVLFSQALTSVLADSPTQLAVEVGPHPALKGPALQTIQEAIDSSIPYAGTLSRQADALRALATCLGFVWQHLGTDGVDLCKFERALNQAEGKSAYKVVKGLPTYQWNHGVRHWYESRTSRQMRLRQNPVTSSLLGDVAPDSGPHCRSWRNLLRTGELEWLTGHQVQGQTVFPAAGYVSTAIEAARSLHKGEDIRMIELNNFIIHQAVVFEQDDAGVDVLISLSDVRQPTPDRIKARFTYSAAMGGGTNGDDLSLAASGDVEVVLGTQSPSLFPERAPKDPHMIGVDSERFYSALATLGYNFSGRFRSLTSMSRKHGKSTCMVQMSPSGPDDETPLIHPAELDAAFQSVILAYSYPHDDQLRSLHLPTNIGRIRINPALCKAGNRTDVALVPVDAALTPNRAGSATPARGFSGNIQLFTENHANVAIQVEGVRLVPLGGSAVDQDRNVFSKLEWINSAPDALTAARDTVITQDHCDILIALERISAYYLRQFDLQVAPDDPIRSERPYSCYLEYAKHVVKLVEGGQHRWFKREWKNDSLEDVLEATKDFSDIIDVRVMHLVGQTMPKAFRGETTMLENFRTTGLLDEYYAKGFGLGQSSIWISRAVAQITDRYPQLKMLEIGAGTGGATKNIFRAIGNNFLSYTFTDISAGFFGNAASIFSTQKDHMVFKTFDAEHDPVGQGFAEGGYDLIVASFVIHATAELQRTMKNIRKLLRPGGFLVVGEGSHTSDPGCFIFGTLPGWWLGYDEGRTLSPHVSPDGWDKVLKATGFSGIDTIAPQDFQDVLGVSLFVSQAVDDGFNMLREPLASPPQTFNQPIQKLVILGGQTPRSTQIIKESKRILEKYAIETHVFASLNEVDYNIVDENSTVLSMTDLDKPVFQDMTPETFLSFRKMFESEKTILWVTSGRLSGTPWSNITVGFGRTAVNETPDLRLQHLDISDPEKADPMSIAKVLLRFHLESQDRVNALSSPEPEILLDADGRQLVPRLRHLVSPNARYNSARRPISRNIDPTDVGFTVKQDDRGIRLESLPRGHSRVEYEEPVSQFKATHAVVTAIQTPLGPRFLAIGEESRSGGQCLALLPSLDSSTTIPLSHLVPCETSSEATLLSRAAAHITAMTIVDRIFSGQRLVLHNPTALIALAVNTQASAKGVVVAFTADSEGAEEDTASIPGHVIQLSPYSSKEEIFQALPREISCFVGFSSPPSEVESIIASGLPEHCHKISSKALFSRTGCHTEVHSSTVLTTTLQRALDQVQKGDHSALPAVPSGSVVTLDEANESEAPNNSLSVVDLTSSNPVDVHYTRLDTTPMFRNKRTYWLAGLSGALGISLCDWMIDRGARFLVLSSRTPRIDASWIEHHKRNGVTIEVIPCDVTDESALRAVHETIKSTLPPIAGVLNGAMVLRDTSVRNMSYDQLMDVVRPKVLGSIHMDNIFRDDILDFFILFSSINCIIGNTGQANYAGANTFMCSLAAQRRARGLAATALNVGAIIGAGYIERESSKALDLTVAKGSLMHLSEEDFHQLFAEAIEAGHPDNPDGPEVSTGVLEVAADSPDPPRWISDPKFSFFVTHRKMGESDKAEDANAVSIQDLLQNCQTGEDVEKVVRESFATELRNELQVTTPDDELMAMRSQEIGLDSLVSVDIRTWFLKNFQVSIPVLKIMGNETMANLVKIALDNLPPELIPNAGTVEVSGDTSSSSPDDQSSLSGNGTTDTPAETTTSTEDDVGKQIDWDFETSPADDLAAVAGSILGAQNDAPVRSPPKVVVLTGVSGLLGHHLLNYLLSHTSLDQVICIAVRQLSQRLASGELPPQGDRVAYYEGDLSLPRLGLSEDAARAVFSEADAIIHNGADTGHLKSYGAVSAANVGSTRELVALAAARRIPFHYVSSVGAALFSSSAVVLPASAAGASPPADGSHGYMASKWACERLLERVSETHGLDVCIHRPSTIVREGEDAIGSKASKDWVNVLLQYVRLLKAAPRVAHIRGALDLVYVQSVCSDLVGHLLGEGSAAGAGPAVRYVHEVGDVVIELDRLHEVGVDKARGGKAFDVVPMNEWIDRAIAAGMHGGVAALIEAMDVPDTPDYPRIQKGSALG